jgi:hypothetical protein
MIEIPNNSKHEEIMDFKKFAQSKGLIYSEERVFIEGVFKWEDGTITKGDNFWADRVHTSGEPINAEEIYKTYLDWFNRTLKPFEHERFFVSAKFGRTEDEEEKMREKGQ